MRVGSVALFPSIDRWFRARRRSAAHGEALLESEARFRSLFEDAPIAYHEIDRNGVVQRVNQAECELLGLDRAQMVGRPVWEFVAPEARETSRRAVARKIAGEQALAPFLREYLRGDGTQVMVEIHERLIRDAQGNVTGIRSALLDVTARHRAEQALQESEARYRNLFENVPIGIYRTTPGGRILMANPALVQMLGYSSFEELATRNLEHEGFDPSYDRREFRAALEGGGEIKGCEALWRRRDGARIAVRENARAVRAGDGTVLYYEGTVEDVTDRKRAEEALEQVKLAAGGRDPGLAAGHRRRRSGGQRAKLESGRGEDLRLLSRRGARATGAAHFLGSPCGVPPPARGHGGRRPARRR